jgi:hypothetical protein
LLVVGENEVDPLAGFGENPPGNLVAWGKAKELYCDTGKLQRAFSMTVESSIRKPKSNHSAAARIRGKIKVFFLKLLCRERTLM